MNRNSSVFMFISFLCLVLTCSLAPAQVMDDLGFRALPRKTNHNFILVGKDAPAAVIVFGRDAAWTKSAAEAVQKAVQEWCDRRLELVDDRTVTNEESWLLSDECRKTPMIVLGNSQDNRLMHALGTRYLLQSNRSWPGGDRYILRSIFEPFVADVNYIVLEASTPAGLSAAVDKFRAMLPRFDKTALAIPRIREVGGVKDKWRVELPVKNEVKPMIGDPGRSVSQIAADHKGKILGSGWEIRCSGIAHDLVNYSTGGRQDPNSAERITVDLDVATLKANAAMCLLASRACGNRTHLPYDHYGAMPTIPGWRAIFDADVLTERELNEFESSLTHSAADPDHYFYNHIGNGDLLIGGPWGDRHCQSCQLLSLHTLDYVLNHCRLDDRTRKEVARRLEGARKTTALQERSFRNNCETSCLGEDTVLQFYSVLHQGFMRNIRGDYLRRGADMYILTTDNVQSNWGQGCYAGLGGFATGPGGSKVGWLGGTLVCAAAYYYDDPQYRWLINNRPMHVGSEGASALPMHSTKDPAGRVEPPTRYYGVAAISYDERLYRATKYPVASVRDQYELRHPPEPFEKAMDRAAFRDGFGQDDAYLFLMASQDLPVPAPAQNNSIARMTDLGDIWLFTNTTATSTWSRNVVSISNGREFLPVAACTNEALANLGQFSAISSKESGVGGADWTRTIAHWRGHYFVILDRVQGRQDDSFSLVCRWRTPHPAAIEDGRWVATSPVGNRMRIQSAQPVFQLAESWECDGSEKPYVLQQYKQAQLAKGQSATFQNLIFVSGDKRPDEFEARSVSDLAMLVYGKMREGEHLALVGTSATRIPPGVDFPLREYQTDAAIYLVTGDLLHLAGATVIRAKIDGAMRELFWSSLPVNVLLDCRTGKAQIEPPTADPVQMMVAGKWGLRKGRLENVEIAAAGTLPQPAPLLEAMWKNTPADWTKGPGASAGAEEMFRAATASEPLTAPLRRLNRVELGSNPPWQPWGYTKIWNDTKGLEITLTFPEPTAVQCLRLVGIDKGSSNGFGSDSKHYKKGDFAFSLVLSDDGFKNDLRKIDNPRVTWEETPVLSMGHSLMNRLPTWRVEVGQNAKQIRLMPRAATQERASLQLRGLEAYGRQRVAELGVQMRPADLNGDGLNELIVATSQRELAAFDSQGKQLWRKEYGGDVLQLETADLDEDGKSEVLAFDSTERLHRIGGDGKEWPGGDLNEFQVRTIGKYGFSGVTLMGAWAPDGVKKKEVLLWAEPCYRVLADGTIKPEKIRAPQGMGRLVNLFPDQPEVLVVFRSGGATLWSANRDADSNYTKIGQQPVLGYDGGERAGFWWYQQVDRPGQKGFLAAVEGGMNYIPAAAYTKAGAGDEKSWSLQTGGVPIVAAACENIGGTGSPAVFVARRDGFVNVLRLSDGAELCMLSTGEPILGMCKISGKDGKPMLAVGTKFGLHVFCGDPATGRMKKVGVQKIPTAAGFAGPGGKGDRVYVVDPAGNVTVMVLKS